MLPNVADVVGTEHRSRTEFVLKAEIHLPRAGGSVIRVKDVKPVDIGGVQSCTHKVSVGLQPDVRGSGSLKGVAECQNLGRDGRDGPATKGRRDRGCTGYGPGTPSYRTAQTGSTTGPIRS